MKRKIAVFLLNLIVILVLLLVADMICYRILSKRPFSFQDYIVSTKLITFEDIVSNFKYRDVIKPKSKKKPVLIFGCSFAYGYGLEFEQSLSYKLADLTGRSVYNRAVPSTGLQYFLYMLKHFDIQKEIPTPEYIIYLMIDHHLFRLFRPYWGYTDPIIDIRYKNDNGKLKEYINKFYQLGKFTIYRTLSYRFNDFIFNHTLFDEKFDFMKMYYKEAKEIINKKFPNSKIVILCYEENENSFLYRSPRWKELEKEGFIVLNSYTLTGVHLSELKYKIENDVHPNEKAFDTVAKALVNELKI